MAMVNVYECYCAPFLRITISFDKLYNANYSGAKHIPLSSQRPFHFHCSIRALFHSDQTNTIV